MAYPDTTISNPWVHGVDVSEVDMYNNVTAPLNLIVPRLSDGGYITPTLGNSWVALGAPYAAPRYRLKAGIVYLDGAMKSGTTGTVFTLPTGMRPLSTVTLNGSSGTALAILNVTSAGLFQVIAYGTGGSNASLAMGGLSFVAEQ